MSSSCSDIADVTIQHLRASARANAIARGLGNLTLLLLLPAIIAGLALFQPSTNAQLALVVAASGGSTVLAHVLVTLWLFRRLARLQREHTEQLAALD